MNEPTQKDLIDYINCKIQEENEFFVILILKKLRRIVTKYSCVA